YITKSVIRVTNVSAINIGRITQSGKLFFGKGYKQNISNKSVEINTLITSTVYINIYIYIFTASSLVFLTTEYFCSGCFVFLFLGLPF
ncbi:hypothetical protein IscW_ISCW018639, partial [Ixodes scapularis]